MSPPDEREPVCRVKGLKGQTVKAPAGYRLVHLDEDEEDDEGDLKLQADQAPQRWALEKMVGDEDHAQTPTTAPANSSGVLETDFLQRLELFIGQHSYQNVRPYQEDRTAFKVYGRLHMCLLPKTASAS